MRQLGHLSWDEPTKRATPVVAVLPAAALGLGALGAVAVWHLDILGPYRSVPHLPAFAKWLALILVRRFFNHDPALTIHKRRT